MCVLLTPVIVAVHIYPHTMLAPNFFSSSNSVERVFLTEDQAFWIDFKSDLTMEDMAGVNDIPKADAQNGGEVNPYSSMLIMLRACIVAWNLPDPEVQGKVMDLTMENVRKLHVSVFAKLAPYIKKAQEGNFLSERSEMNSAPQSSSESPTQTI